MTIKDIIFTILEIAMVAGAFWCIFNEQHLIHFEDKIKAYFRRRRLKVVKGETKKYLIHNR